MERLRSQRVLQLKSQIVELRDEKVPVAEIAKRFSVSVKTIYDVLREIASEDGIPYEHLLYHTRTNGVHNNPRSRSTSKVINRKEIYEKRSKKAVKSENMNADLLSLGNDISSNMSQVQNLLSDFLDENPESV